MITVSFSSWLCISLQLQSLLIYPHPCSLAFAFASLSGLIASVCICRAAPCFHSLTVSSFAAVVHAAARGSASALTMSFHVPCACRHAADSHAAPSFHVPAFVLWHACCFLILFPFFCSCAGCATTPPRTPQLFSFLHVAPAPPTSRLSFSPRERACPLAQRGPAAPRRVRAAAPRHHHASSSTTAHVCGRVGRSTTPPLLSLSSPCLAPVRTGLAAP